VLMQHDRHTGKLDMKSKEVIRDPASVKRLLEAEMISPTGKLTPQAHKKCAALAGKLKIDAALRSAGPVPAGGRKPAAAPVKKVEKVSATHWAMLMKYDRKTGNLLRIDPKTGRLDRASRLILKDPTTIQRLIDENLILPGGWLTPEAKKRCVRIEKKIKVRAQDRISRQGAHLARKSKNQPEPEAHSGRKPEIDRNLQAFFKNLPRDAMVDATGSEKYAGYDRQDEEDLQAFFQNLPDDPPGPDPWTYFAYDWQNERDLQAYFENLPQDLPGAGTGAQPGRESVLRTERIRGSSRKDIRSKKS